ncbi:MAG: hypothetical protein WCK67_05345 [bacterium]
MKKVCEQGVNQEMSRKSSLVWFLENQHPVVCWWFVLSSLSFCSVYFMLLTKFQ